LYKLINWDDLFKVRIGNSDESFQKHEVIKLLIVMKLLKKYSRNKNLIRIYTEFEIDGGLICDVYFENMKTNSVIAYEIQKKITNEWQERTVEKYDKVTIPYIKTVDLVIVNLNECPDNIQEINKWLEEYLI